MRNNLRVLLILLAAFLLATGCRKFDPKPAPPKKAIPVLEQSFVNLGTHNLGAYSIIKNSKYLVVFESGLNGDHTAWDIWEKNNIAPIISDSMDVVTYDRGGMGASQNGPVPRDINRLQSELGSIIDAFANGRKIILIGHSLGGFIIRDWAIKNPTRVAGLLFVDSSHEDCSQITQADQDVFYNSWLTAYGANYGATLEAKEWKNDVDYMGTVENLPDVPVIVLTAMQLDATNSAAFRQEWYAAHESLKDGVTDFTHISMPNSGHLVMIDAPQIVINYINVLLAKLP